MADYFNHLLFETHVTLPTTLLRLLLALLLGLCIGAERQVSRHDAGLRTFTLICLGSAGAVILSIWIPQTYPDLLNGDPGRIAAQVLTGIGFLGAGAIVRSKGGIQGLTTAACIWQTSIVGMTAGAGLYVGSVVMMLMTLFVLRIMEKAERALHIDRENLIMTLNIDSSTPDIEKIKRVVVATGAQLRVSSLSTNLAENTSTVTFRLTLRSRIRQTDILLALQEIEEVSSVNIVA